MNAFVVWRILERIDYLDGPETFRTLERYRQIFNNVQSLGDFVIDLSIYLLLHASRIASNDEHVENDD